MKLSLLNLNKNCDLQSSYFLVLFSILPISIIIGSAASLLNILMIILSFIIIFDYKKNLFLLRDKTIITLFLLFLYLIFNSLISINFEIGILRNFGFLRYIFLFIVINYFFFSKENTDKIFKIWFTIFCIVLFDTFYEVIIGHNILGYGGSDTKRVVSFFKDEFIVGSFLNGLFFIIVGFLFSNFEKKNNYQKYLIYLFLILVVTGMIFSGERSNTIKLLVGLTIFFYFNNVIKFQHKLLFTILLITIFFVSFNKFSEVKHRYYNDLVAKLQNKEKRENYIYFKIYRSGFEVFKKYPIFGAGNKNYRIETCKKDKERNKNYYCITHPHQIYLEFLSEHGLIGSLILLILILYLIFQNLKIMLIKKNLIQISTFAFLLTHFVPLIPSGSFFSDFNANFFWINLSILYAVNNDTNIFYKQKN